MGGFDWIIAAIFLVSVIVGVARGFVKDVLSLASWIVAIWLAWNFSVEAGEFVHQYIRIPTPKFRAWVGFGSIFIVTLFLFAMVAYGISKALVRGPVKGIDRVLGIVPGAARAAAIVVLILIVSKGFGLQASGWWSNSQFIGKFAPLVNYVESLFPEEWQSESEGNNELRKGLVEGVIDAVPSPDGLLDVITNSSESGVEQTQNEQQSSDDKSDDLDK